MKKHIPNIITSVNLLCGVFSIYLIIGGYPVYGAYFIFLAALLDFLDGLTARLLHAYSDMGKQLDSLADLISFGVAPALLYMAYIDQQLDLSFMTDGFAHQSIQDMLVLFSPVVLVLCTALRLARFNISIDQGKEFLGLPSPASGLFFAAFSLSTSLEVPALVLLALPLFFSYLMVSRIPMFSLKVESIRDRKVVLIGFLVLTGLILLLVFSVKYIFIIIILYIFMALVIPVFTKTKP